MTNRWTRKPEALAQTHFVCRGSRMRGKHGSNICIVTVKWRSTVSLWYVDYGRQPEKVAGNKLELILYKLTSTPLKGILLGTAVTAIIQSSSATTVMVVGFVNSGMMKVAQSIGIIMGANIGTSVTGWILCLSYIDGSSGIAQILSTATISAVVAIIGIIFRMVMKKDSYRHLGEIMLGFAILMFGMQTMSGAVAPLKDNETFRHMLTMFTNPVAGILVGILFTAVLQSVCSGRYSAGIIRYRRNQLCSCTSDHHGYRCRSCLSCTYVSDRYE